MVLLCINPSAAFGSIEALWDILTQRQQEGLKLYKNFIICITVKLVYKITKYLFVQLKYDIKDIKLYLLICGIEIHVVVNTLP